ncbi:hypothetical protein RJT34_19350 [Clitoria ternatea]|uniref:Uncharacterized protein n=1 Tax=Clitoria ternatea TaxID=43366 RepID=A0AAN9P495_CLITE
MEQTPNNVVVTDPPLQDDQPKPITPKKKSSPMHALRVALFKMGGKSRKSIKVAQDNNNNDNDSPRSTWKKFVGSMRPLHLQSTRSPRAVSQPASPASSDSKTDIGGSVSDFPTEEEPFSPSPSSSRYASAVGLNEMVHSDEENEKPEVIVEEDEHADTGDETIDAKAEEFISQFYEQMRLQRLDSVDLRYIERSERSLGF